MSRRFIASRAGAAAVALYTCLYLVVRPTGASEPGRTKIRNPAAIWNSPSIPFKEPHLHLARAPAGHQRNMGRIYGGNWIAGS